MKPEIVHVARERAFTVAEILDWTFRLASTAMTTP
jgi:hypothetical protein